MLPFEQRTEGRFESDGIAQLLGVISRETQRLEGVVKADNANPLWNLGQMPNRCGDIGGAAQTDIPKHPLLIGRCLEAFRKPELPDVQGLGLGDGANDGVKSFPFGQGADAGGAVGQLDQGVSEFHRCREARGSDVVGPEGRLGLQGQSDEASSSEPDPLQRPGSAQRPRVEAAAKVIISWHTACGKSSAAWRNRSARGSTERKSRW